MRVRKEEDKWMPPRVYKHSQKGKYTCYILKPTGSQKSITLCKSYATKAEVWREYEKHMSRAVYTLRCLVSDYMQSPNFKALAPRTQKDRQIELNNILSVFGEMLPDAVLPQHVRRYVDKRGLKSQVQANHELSSLSVIYKWGYERGHCKSNPAQGVKKFAIKERDRYITQAEYQALISCAEERLRLAVEISYLCATRQADVLKLKWEHVLEDGLYIQQGKTGKKQIKAWTDRLKNIIDEANTLRTDFDGDYVINKAGGGRLTGEGIRSAWKRAIVKMKVQFPEIKTDFTFHDIKAKGISDFDGTIAEKQHFSGHKTMRQVDTYDRRVPIVSTVKDNDE